MSITAFTPSSTTVEVITSIWEHVLQKSPIGIEEDFFGLGGNYPLAVEIFHEITQRCGRELSPILICQAPTVAALAALLAETTTPKVPALMLLKPGSDHPPVYIAHGLGDTLTQLVPFVRQIQSSHPIFGMQAMGMDRADKPVRSIEEMAQYHLTAIKQLQPRGPYFLIGYSLGGLVALEIARYLSKKGEKIALLAMLDSYPDMHTLSFAQRVQLTWHLATRRLAVKLQAFKRGNPSISEDQPQMTKYALKMQHIRDCDYQALSSYKPHFYQGKIKFVKASISSFFPENPTAVWSPYTEEFEVECIPGDHVTMLTTHSASLASLVSRYLQEAAKDDSMM